MNENELQMNEVMGTARKLLKNNIGTILEIGARDCVETLVFNKNFPDSRIFTFECNPSTLPKCRNNVSNVSNIELIESAVSDKDGRITFNQIDSSKTITGRNDGNPGASSLFKASGKYPVEAYVQKEIRVPSIRLDTFFTDKGIDEVDILWMDIQGAELMALKSAGEHIKKIKIIHLELEFFEIYKDQPLFKEVHAFLKQNGFCLLKFTTVGKYAGDAIYVNEDLKKTCMPVVMLKYISRLKRKIRNIMKK